VKKKKKKKIISLKIKIYSFIDGPNVEEVEFAFLIPNSIPKLSKYFIADNSCSLSLLSASPYPNVLSSSLLSL
jgi:hypothetical protein